MRGELRGKRDLVRQDKTVKIELLCVLLFLLHGQAEGDCAMTSSSSSVEVIVKLKAASAEGRSTAYRCVQAEAADCGVLIKPLHPETTDPELASFYVGRVAVSQLDRFSRRLLACEGVEGAYGKPPGEPPRGE